MPTRVFRWAGIYGIAAVAPLYFLEAQIGLRQPPPITHPEYFYAFAGVTLAWQIVFLVISTDPPRYRPLMPVAMIEKLAVLPLVVLFFQGRIAGQALALWMIDWVWFALFAVAYLKTSKSN